MWMLSLVPFMLQALAISIDEVWFHRRRGLPRWERIGHPVDTLTVVICMGYVLFFPYSKQAILPYALLAIASSLMVTKDEFVHKECCPASEQWLHAILFILHPIALLSASLIWPASQGIETAPWLSSLVEQKKSLHLFLIGQFLLMVLFMAYQTVYWNFIWEEAPRKRPETRSSKINNSFYETLGKLWNAGTDHPIALLRSENKLRTPWIRAEIARRFASPVSILDIGCGAGILANALVQDGHRVAGVDLSESSLRVARENDLSGSVEYRLANACSIPFPDASFEAVCAMDILEHVEEPERLIAEAARILKPGGIFFFHTFNRNPLSYIVVIKGVEWCVRNTPPNMHVYSLFIKPAELKRYCSFHALHVGTVFGFRPKFFSFPFMQMLLTRKVSESFSFRFSKSLATGYCGIAQKSGTLLF